MAEDRRSNNIDGIARLLRPRAVAIIGMSSKPGTAGQTILANLTLNAFAGDIHLVGRSGGSVEGRPVLDSIDALPEGIDLAIFALPAAAVRDAVAACARRKIGAAVIFAGGFAETGNRAAQDELAAVARAGGVALLGPNCFGYTSFVDRFRVNFASPAPIAQLVPGRDPACAIVSHSGGLATHILRALEARDLPISYNISTGNEAGLGLADFVAFFADDPATRAIVLYVEQVREPAAFLAAAARARAAGKPVVMMHPGRSERAKTATTSHTGALAGNYAVMRTLLSHAGIAFVDTLDELIDTAEILARYPETPRKGPGILTFSGAYCAIAHDFCADLGLDIPAVTPATAARLQSRLPPFAAARNPLDLTTQPVFEPELFGFGAKALLDDPNLGSLFISIINATPQHGMAYLNGLIAAMQGSDKPVVLSMLGDRDPLPAEFTALAREHRIILSRSADRSLRAVARATFHGRALARGRASEVRPFSDLPRLGKGAQPEWRSKQVLAAAGIRIPAGRLVATVEEAAAAAAQLGYPVAMKAQAGALPHKTEAGAVLLAIADEASLRAAWHRLQDNVAQAQPGLALDGVLVERMAAKGLELMVGAKRDPLWGPVLLVGLGGIWVEALGDLRLLPPDLDEGGIVAEIEALRSAKLLHGFRGAPALDIAAVARTLSTIGQIMRNVPEITEIDINPLFVHPKGDGVTAVDALIVTRRLINISGDRG